ncbi:hypothetical protein Tcan_02219 [Toxocara canis]|uniref:Uncharacterized protein n=1 Tax=Toxocara canis TaxID=6265 RepID=A0A0B2URE8_TOXCA|nr:hypothetical protein Tcan_02219 [Toxocara canis]
MEQWISADSREVIELEEQDALGSRLKVEENGCPAIGETRKREKVDGLNEQMMCAIDPEVDSKSKAMSAESDRLRTELDQGRLELEVLNTSSHQGASLEQELNMVRAGRGAAIAALNIELAASRVAYESKSTALLEAERRIAHLELQLTNKSDLAYAVVRDASISSQVPYFIMYLCV